MSVCQLSISRFQYVLKGVEGVESAKSAENLRLRRISFQFTTKPTKPQFLPRGLLSRFDRVYSDNITEARVRRGCSGGLL